MLQATELSYLTELSPRDKPWDKRKAQADCYQTLYLDTSYHKRAERIANCSSRLVFKTGLQDNKRRRYKLKTAMFCRVPHCPICQSRRALKWNSKTRQIMPRVLEAYPKSRFIMLTLTVPNCDLTDLRSTLGEMNKAWRNLIRRKELKIQGWIRTTEVTRADDDKAHPHYHALLMVPPSYFTGANYITQERWTELWASSLKTGEFRKVDVRAVKPKKGALNASETEAILSATVEVIKYAVKPSDNLIDEHDTQRPGQRVRMSNQDWLVGLTDQLHKTRLIATGGVLKDYFKELEDERKEANQDLIHIRENALAEPDSDEPDKVFDWYQGVKRYAAS